MLPMHNLRMRLQQWNSWSWGIWITQRWHVWLSLVWSLALVYGAFTWFEPMYATNDDIGMAMRVHGFGQYAEASPYIVYSNIVWGWVLYTLPAIGSVYAYAWTTVLIMMGYIWGLTYFGLRSAAPWWIVLPVISWLVAEPLVFPQFTIHASMLSVVMILAVLQYARTPSWWLIAVMVVSGVLGMWIRTFAWCVVVAMASPLLLTPRVRAQRVLQLVGIGMMGVLGVSIALNGWAYQQTPELREFETLYRTYQPIFNNNAVAYFEAQPQVLAQTALSENDLQLIVRRFLIAGPLRDQAVLQQVVDQLPLFRAEVSAGLMVQNLAVLYRIAPGMLMLGLVLMWRARRWRLWAVAGLMILSVIIVALAGRVAPGRVSYPLVMTFVLLVLVSMPRRVWQSAWWWQGVVLVVVAWGIWTALPVIQQREQRLRAYGEALFYDLQTMPYRPVIAWAGSFEYEYAFPVRRLRSDVPNVPIYALTIAAIQPTAVGYQESLQGRDVGVLLTQPGGVALVADAYMLPWIEQYCADHYQAPFVAEAEWVGAATSVYRMRCVLP